MRKVIIILFTPAVTKVSNKAFFSYLFCKQRFSMVLFCFLLLLVQSCIFKKGFYLKLDYFLIIEKKRFIEQTIYVGLEIIHVLNVQNFREICEKEAFHYRAHYLPHDRETARKLAGSSTPMMSVSITVSRDGDMRSSSGSPPLHIFKKPALMALPLLKGQ